MIKRIFTVVLILSSILIAQNEEKPLVKAERQRFAKMQELSKVTYPGDSKIDVTYYGLDLAITTSPNNISGNVTIGVRTDTSSINNCFLDLRDFLVVDSIWINGMNTTYVHSNNIINIDLDHTYVLDEEF